MSRLETTFYHHTEINIANTKSKRLPWFSFSCSIPSTCELWSICICLGCVIYEKKSKKLWLCECDEVRGMFRLKMLTAKWCVFIFMWAGSVWVVLGVFERWGYCSSAQKQHKEIYRTVGPEPHRLFICWGYMLLLSKVPNISSTRVRWISLRYSMNVFESLIWTLQEQSYLHDAHK